MQEQKIKWAELAACPNFDPGSGMFEAKQFLKKYFIFKRIYKIFNKFLVLFSENAKNQLKTRVRWGRAAKGADSESNTLKN